MEVLVVVAPPADALSRTSIAHVPQALSTRLGLVSGSYIELKADDASQPRYLRVCVEADEQNDPNDAIRVDYGLDGSDTSAGLSVRATARVVAPARLRVAQYVTLHPTAPDQPKLPLAMAKALLKKTILRGAIGELQLQLQGVEYGAWRYKAYYRGTRRRRRRLSQDASEDEDEWVLDAGIVNDDTMLSMSPFSAGRDESDVLRAKLKSPGMGPHGRPLRDLLKLALFPPIGVAPISSSVMQPRSLLLHGPSGCGKSTLVRLIATELEVNILTFDGSILATPHFRIEDVFTAALRIQPCVIVLEDLELIFPKAVDETKYKLVCRFVASLERLRSLSTSSVAVVGNATTIYALNAKIRQVFEEELSLEVPDKTWTVSLLDSLLPNKEVVSRELKLAIAVKYGQRPSNIVSLVQRLSDHGAFAPDYDSSKLHSAVEHFGREISTASSSTHAFHTSIPNVKWEDIGGLSAVKQSLLEMVVWPLEKPEVFLRMGITPPLGMLLHGPPGTGKTMLAKAAASASGCNFLNISASDLMKAEFGESEKAISRVFDTARALSPCLVFIDEFQSLFGNRTTAGVTTSRMISQLLVEMDSLKALADDRERETSSTTQQTKISGDRVFVLAATNALNAIDPAFLQPGRFENILYVGVPAFEERLAILKLQQAKMPWHDNVNLEYLAEMTAGANAASIVALCQAAAIKAMQRVPVDAPEQTIEFQDFLLALESSNFDFIEDAHQ